jgi:hypothetical protein
MREKSMPRYLALSDGYLGRRPGFVQKGTQFDYDGKPGKWMLLVDPSQAAKAPVLTKAEQAKADKEAAKAAKAAAKAGGAGEAAGEPSGSGDKEVI